MNGRIQRLRQLSLNTHPSVSIERAVLLTDFYRENMFGAMEVENDRLPPPVRQQDRLHWR